MVLCRRIRASLFIVCMACLSMVACTTAPVQEMSDARQALRAAEQVGAAQKASASYDAAKHLLDQAEQALQDGKFTTARDSALSAKEYAIEARQRAVRNNATQ